MNIKIDIGGWFLALLSLIFITLKLTGVINWPLWIVLLPLYGPFIVVALVVVIVFIIYKIKSRH